MASTSPVSIEQARVHVKADASDDPMLEIYLASAVDWIEGHTCLLLSPRDVTEQVTLSRGALALRWWPVNSVGAVKYSTSGVEVTAPGADYQLIVADRPAKIGWPLGAPSVLRSIPAFVTYNAGFGTLDEVPGVVKQAALVLVAEFFRNREAGKLSGDTERAVAGLLRRYRYRTL